MDMLRNITAGSAAASNPLLKSLLGPQASEEEYRALAEEAENIWKTLDDLSENNPDGYEAFVRDAAKAAREEVERSRDPHVEGLMPALVLEAQAQQGGGREPDGGPAGLARVVAAAAGQAVARVHIWAANDASGVGPATAGGQPVAPQQSAWSGLAVPVAQYKPATTRPGPLPVHSFHVACHVTAVRMCVAGQPAGFPAAFLEAVTQFVEAEYGLALSRTLRTLQVHREAVSDAQWQALEQQHEERLRAAAGSGPGSESAAGEESSLPRGLLDELRSLGTAPTKTPKQPPTAATAGSGKEPTAKKKALIEELD